MGGPGGTDYAGHGEGQAAGGGEKRVFANLQELNEAFAEVHAHYYTYEWTWAWEQIKAVYDVELETITAADVVRIVKRWQEAVVGLDRMLYEDAKKEFSLSAMTGFGVDGQGNEKQLDFEQVRGDFESNPFVMAILQHIEVKTALGNELIGRMEGLTEVK